MSALEAPMENGYPFSTPSTYPPAWLTLPGVDAAAINGVASQFVVASHDGGATNVFPGVAEHLLSPHGAAFQMTTPFNNSINNNNNGHYMNGQLGLSISPSSNHPGFSYPSSQQYPLAGQTAPAVSPTLPAASSSAFPGNYPAALPGPNTPTMPATFSFPPNPQPSPNQAFPSGLSPNNVVTPSTAASFTSNAGFPPDATTTLPINQIGAQQQQQQQQPSQQRLHLAALDLTDLGPMPDVEVAKGERFSYSRDQLEVLNAVFRRIPQPSSAQKNLVARVLKVGSNQCKIWFQNRRRKGVMAAKGQLSKNQVDTLNIDLINVSQETIDIICEALIKVGDQQPDSNFVNGVYKGPVDALKEEINGIQDDAESQFQNKQHLQRQQHPQLQQQQQQQKYAKPNAVHSTTSIGPTPSNHSPTYASMGTTTTATATSPQANSMFSFPFPAASQPTSPTAAASDTYSTAYAAATAAAAVVAAAASPRYSPYPLSAPRPASLYHPSLTPTLTPASLSPLHHHPRSSLFPSSMAMAARYHAYDPYSAATMESNRAFTEKLLAEYRHLIPSTTKDIEHLHYLYSNMPHTTGLYSDTDFYRAARASIAPPNLKFTLPQKPEEAKTSETSEVAAKGASQKDKCQSEKPSSSENVDRPSEQLQNASAAAAVVKSTTTDVREGSPCVSIGSGSEDQVDVSGTFTLRTRRRRHSSGCSSGISCELNHGNAKKARTEVNETAPASSELTGAANCFVGNNNNNTDSDDSQSSGPSEGQPSPTDSQFTPQTSPEMDAQTSNAAAASNAYGWHVAPQIVASMAQSYVPTFPQNVMQNQGHLAGFSSLYDSSRIATYQQSQNNNITNNINNNEDNTLPGAGTILGGHHNNVNNMITPPPSASIADAPFNIQSVMQQQLYQPDYQHQMALFQCQ